MSRPSSLASLLLLAALACVLVGASANGRNHQGRSYISRRRHLSQAVAVANAVANSNGGNAVVNSNAGAVSTDGKPAVSIVDGKATAGPGQTNNRSCAYKDATGAAIASTSIGVPASPPPPAQDPPLPLLRTPPPSPSPGPPSRGTPFPSPSPGTAPLCSTWPSPTTPGPPRGQVAGQNLPRIGESMQRPIELCQWDDLEALPPVGEEYQQRYKLVNDRLPKVRQRLHRAAEYRRGIDGRARNNA
ncbi:hypothetical protein QJQ45_011692 [Haematococcus lacustris]|nr:hypothetical protein QJQ45_011692 [Haematococcus lacustris]